MSGTVAGALCLHNLHGVILNTTDTKAQISVEFIIIFSFILLIFIILFVIITSERALGLADQTFSQLQLVAGSLAIQLTRAAQAGSGYSTRFPFISSVGNVRYNVTLTKTGVITVSSLVGNQIVRAVAYSNVQNIVVKPSYVIAGRPNVYFLPVGNGSISITNSGGNLCIDYSCPTTSNQTSSISLTTQVVHAAQFNGYTTNMVVAGSNTMNQTKTMSVVLFAKFNSQTMTILEKDKQGGGEWGLFLGNIGGGTAAPGQIYTQIGDNQMCSSYAFTLLTNTWYQIAFTYNGHYMTEYVNGKQYCSNSNGVPSSLTTSSAPLTVGNIGDAGIVEPFNGSIANLQMYNSSLTANQVYSLYQGGIGGSAYTQNLVGWWPLNGDANDYSGNANNAAITGPLLFPTVAEIFAKVTNATGQPVSGIPAGFATTAGNFTSGRAFMNYTSSNGIAVAFLNQQNNNGNAFVKATAFNGNITTAPLLAAWYPLNLGQGNKEYDVNIFHNNGVVQGAAYWNAPNYVSSFDGSYSYIQTPISALFTPGKFTVSFWFNSRKIGGNYNSANSVVILSNGALGGSGGSNWWFEYGDNGLLQFKGSTGSAYVNINTTNAWYYVTGMFDGTNLNLSIDGARVGSTLGTIGSGTKSFLIGNGLCGTSNLCYLGNYAGSITNLQFYNTILQANQINNMYQAGIDAVPTNTQILAAWYPLDGNANDYSGNKNNGTIFGNVSFTKTSSLLQPQQVVSGNVTSLTVPGFNGFSYVAVPPLNALNGSSAASMSAWIQTNSLTSKQIILSDDWLSPQVVQMYVQTNGVVEADFGTSGNSWIVKAQTANAPIVPNTLYHVAATWASGSGAWIYVNSVPQPILYSLGSGATSGTLGLPVNGQIANNQGNGGVFSGIISNLQIYKTALTQQQVRQIYSGGLNGLPATTNSTLVAWYLLNGNANDYSNNSYNGTPMNLSYRTFQTLAPHLLSALNGSGMQFNGQNAYINNVIPLARIPTGNMQYTITAWIDPLSVNNIYGTNSGIVGWGNYGSNNQVNAFKVSSANQLINYWWGNNLTVTAGNLLNKWSFVAAEFNGTTRKIYVNGNVVGSDTPANHAAALTNFGIGKTYNNEYFNGSIADVQIYNGSLTNLQVSQLYQAQIPPSASTVIPLGLVP